MEVYGLWSGFDLLRFRFVSCYSSGSVLGRALHFLSLSFIGPSSRCLVVLLSWCTGVDLVIFCGCVVVGRGLLLVGVLEFLHNIEHI